MNKTATCSLGAAVLGSAAACSSGSARQAHSSAPAAVAKPAISAAAACKDFARWYATTVSGTHLADNSALAKAVSEAPSGQLYQDMSTVRQNLVYLATLSGGLQQATRTLVLEQIDNVVTSDCASINPNG